MTNQQGAPEAPSYEHRRAIMEGERNASLDAYSRVVHLTQTESRIYEAAFTNGWNRLAALVEALRKAHVQNPAEIEHVAGDVSKNGAESNMSTQQTAPAGFVPVAAFDRLYAHAESLAAQLLATHQRDVQEPCGWIYDWTHSSATGKPDTTYTGFTKDEAHARKHDNCIAVFTTQQPAPATQQAGEVVAHRVMRNSLYSGWVCDGRYWSDGPPSKELVESICADKDRWRVDVAYAAPQPSPTAQAAESVPAVVDGPTRWFTVVYRDISAGDEARLLGEHPKASAMSWSHAIRDRDAARASADSVLEDAARLDFLIEQRAYVVSDPDACPGCWLHFVHKETGKCLVQIDEHPTPRAAIDAAMAANGGNK